MSADEFWKDDPQLFVSYRTSFINKKKREMEELDYKSWLIGLYNYDGNTKVGAKLEQTISNGFASFGKNPKFNKEKIPSYTMKPYSELEKDKNDYVENEKKSIYDKEKNSLIYQGSLKQIYLNRLINKSKGE